MDEIANTILKQKRFSSISRGSLIWAFVNAILASVLIFDITVNNSSISKLFEYQLIESISWYLEIVLALLFCWNTVFDIGIYLWPSIGSRSVIVAPVQKTLFGIKDTDLGFIMSTPKKASTPVLDTKSIRPKLLSSFLQSSPYQSTINRQFLNNSNSSNLSNTAQYSPSITQMNYSASSWGGNTTGMTSSPNLSSTCSSWNYYEDYPNSLNSSFHNSFQSDDGNTSLRNRFSQNNTSNIFSSLSDFKITDEKSLENYLDEYNKLETKWNLSNKENSQNNMSYNSVSNILNTSSGLLKKYQYQPACKSPQSSTTLAGDRDSPTTFESESIFGQLKISEDKLSQATENLRKWLNQTILVNLVLEIDSINETLSRQGSPDLQIGDVSLSTLRQISVTKAQILPTLPTLIPYLDLTVNQEYIVRRLRELSKGGCISEFRWNAGGNVDGKSWNDELPTDSALIIHVFCSYLDSRLPPHPNYPDGKTFSSQHFKKTPDKPVFSSDSLYIYQSKINPPHYKLVVGEEIWDVPKGRNNMFYTVLLFLHYIKVNFCGMLDRINLGTSGVNILWTVDELKE